MLLAAGCSNDLPVASSLERTRVLGARVEVAADPGRAEVTPGESRVGHLDRRRAERARDARLGVRALHDGRRRLRGRAAADRRRQRHAGDGRVHDAGRGGAGDAICCRSCSASCAPTGPSASIRIRRCRPAPGPARAERPCASPCRSPPTARRPTATRCSATTSSSWAARRGIPRPRRRRRPATRATRRRGLPVVTATAAGSAAVEAGDPHRQRRRRPRDVHARRRDGRAARGAADLELHDRGQVRIVVRGNLRDRPTRPDADVTVKWEPPAAATVAAGGEVVVFHFVVRDLRGGLDVTSRALCVVAP